MSMLSRLWLIDTPLSIDAINEFFSNLKETHPLTGPGIIYLRSNLEGRVAERIATYKGYRVKYIRN